MERASEKTREKIVIAKCGLQAVRVKWDGVDESAQGKNKQGEPFQEGGIIPHKYPKKKSVPKGGG